MAKKINIIALISTITVIIALSIADSIHNVAASDKVQKASKADPSAMSVDIVIIKEQTIRMWSEFSGRLTAVNFAEIRPQATGLITEVKFEDGQFVNKGDILYVIDPRPLKIIVTQEKANLVVAQNNYALADKEFQRAQDLIKKNLISQQRYDARENTRLINHSAVKLAQARLSEARINLDYAYIKSPFSGHVSRAELTEGNLVSAGPGAPLLTTVVSSESIYADFEIDEQTYSHYMDEMPVSQKNVLKNLLVELRLQSSDVVYRGKVHAFDNRIDSASGTIRVRAIFDNSQDRLLPGMYAHLKLGSNTKEKIILINERAIGTDQDRKFVYIVNNENKTVYREVRPGNSIGENRVIHSGLAAGDRVIVRGLMRIRPNMSVSPKVLTAPETKAVKS